MCPQSKDHVRHVLSGLDQFASLDSETLHELESGASLYRISRGEMLFHKGDTPDGMHLVIDGEIKLFFLSASGTEKLISTIRDGESFGEECVLLAGSRRFSAQSTRDTVGLRLRRQVLDEAMAADSALARVLLCSLSTRMDALMESMENCVQRNSTQRVAHYLVQQTPNSSDHYELQLASNKQEIAAQLNVTPETFSRVLGRLTRDGLIRSQGRCIEVMDRHLLRACAG
ncbi:MAG: Crp/Fnr family transcriptional regulator [Zoogloeaceae bacterium]|nr:Crp/Fnr family transcriptional regulator [Zoogloeaceae bacterium]MCP5238823.1 Crp/Fnr family transcriptional regulator [Zoogloeaceae bacterium]MCP5254290.1 Crp/Fnr family transcriptional regulator [Zoogloeaceae bacterium]